MRDDFIDKLIEEDSNGFNVLIDTLKEVFEKDRIYQKKGNKHHEK